MDQGYLIYPDRIFPDEKFARLKRHFDAKLAALPEGERPEAMDVPHFTDPALFEWLFADEVLDLVEPILGPDIALFASHFICKPKGDGRKVPWHEDSFYWKGMIDPMEVVTVWLAIDPSTEENGCMFVKPGTHRTAQQGFSRRCGYTMRYVSTGTILSPKFREIHHFYLARGKDLSGQSQYYGDPTVSYDEYMTMRRKRGGLGH